MLVELEERPLGGTVIAAVGVSLPDVSVVGGSRVEPYPTCSSMRQREDGAVAAGDGPDAEKGATTAIRGPRKEDAIWPEVEACFKAKCPNEQCGAVNYDRTATIKQIRRCVEVLPWKIGQWSDVEGM
ncbi:hypothetical protein AX17_006865 [Amanita inopinata Kibby_2008]|nr:hypothetical protein AX17_006865 [Amanita inopinata Kibby_2008]